MSILRPEANEIRLFIEELSNKNWIKRSSRNWWPKFVFHFTDLNNVLKIFKVGKLYSRRKLQKLNIKFNDIASPAVINQTSYDFQKYVRLYFRPRTPTQFRNEGIRPKKDRTLGGAHCPIPVFLLFDSYLILSRKDSKFSNGNVGSHYVKVDNSLKFLKTLPFNKIYHIGTISPGYEKEITFHRNAEILISDELDLNSLRYIVCRSEAEKETLINKLDHDIYSSWVNKIIYNPKLDLFERRWTFVEKVFLSDKYLKFYFSPDSQTPGPFMLKLIIRRLGDEKIFSLIKDNFFANNILLVNINKVEGDYTVRMYLDDCLAYEGSFLLAPF